MSSPTPTPARQLIEALCSAQCAGREAGSEGGRKARALVMEAFTQAGLSPEEQAVPGCSGANVLATARSSTPGADRWVMVGAHYDHLGTHGGKTFHGADDNAAAVAELVELGRALAQRPPEGRHVLLAAFDGEEPPHFLSETMGSAHFCRYPTVPLEDLDLMVCLDLMGHALGPPQLPPEVRQTVFALGAERSEGTAALVDQLARQTPGLVVRRADAEMISPLSDYVHFWRRQVPFVFLTCGRWAHYHTPQDTPDRLDFQKIDACARWLELLTRAACARPAGPVRFTDARDDAGTLTSVIDLLGAMQTVSPLAAVAQSQAELLLERCDDHGRLSGHALTEARRLVQQIEGSLG